MSSTQYFIVAKNIEKRENKMSLVKSKVTLILWNHEGQISKSIF